MAENTHFDRSYNPTDSRSSTDSKQVKHKTPKRHTIIKLLETHDKKKIVKASKGKKTHYIQGNKGKNDY